MEKIEKWWPKLKNYHYGCNPWGHFMGINRASISIRVTSPVKTCSKKETQIKILVIFQWCFRHKTLFNNTVSLIFVSINKIDSRFRDFPNFPIFNPPYFSPLGLHQMQSCLNSTFQKGSSPAWHILSYCWCHNILPLFSIFFTLQYLTVAVKIMKYMPQLMNDYGHHPADIIWQSCSSFDCYGASQVPFTTAGYTINFQWFDYFQV